MPPLTPSPEERPAGSLRRRESAGESSNFAAKMAHELNNPLDAVLRFVSLAQRKAKAGEYADLNRYLTDAQFGLERMAEVLRELMDLGRETHEILGRSAPVPLADLIARATRTAAAMAEQKRVSLILKSLLPESAAPAYDLRVAQVLANLLKNAIEAAPENTPVRLTVRSGQWPGVSGQASVASGQNGETASARASPERTDRWPLTTDHSPPTTDHWPSADILIITIEDAGPGIPAELVPHLFTPFLTSKPKGAGFGLGLAISREIVVSLGGSLTLENRAGESTGCVSTVTLPLGGPSAAEARGAL